MPALVGIIKVNIMSSSAVLNVGDVYNLSPFAFSKSFAGAGSFNTGDKLIIHNAPNSTQVEDPDLIDQGNQLNI
ncbi:spore germination protein PA [Scopulibacillus daqui]|uniref:Spore germination protein PA n=1 Tax=Scopulibacillus daqui TaxID=1469162 RepID=A0ABS2Q0N3_9BACL|nr:spore germination protein [Scopulibacillus daqui]MBM7645244.1 spore germination protein PA [Scopulibacillus daqui]